MGASLSDLETQVPQPDAGLRDMLFVLRSERFFEDLGEATVSRSSSARLGRTVTSQNPVVGFRRARTAGRPKTITFPTAPSRPERFKANNALGRLPCSSTFASSNHFSAARVNKWFTI